MLATVGKGIAGVIGAVDAVIALAVLHTAIGDGWKTQAPFTHASFVQGSRSRRGHRLRTRGCDVISSSVQRFSSEMSSTSLSTMSGVSAVIVSGSG